MEQNVLKRAIIECQKGNAGSFRILVTEYQNMVFSLALKLLCCEPEAEDAVQDTFAAVWQNIGKYSEDKGKFSTWIYSIAYRICLDKLKHKKKTVVTHEDESTLQQYVSESNQEHQLMNNEWISIIKALAARLAPKQHIVFTLSTLGDLDTSEIEKITGMSADKIKSNLYVARQKIKEQLMHLGYEQK